MASTPIFEAIKFSAKTAVMSFLYLKALHIIFVVTWFAGLFYVVRLFIYQTEARQKTPAEASILVKEYQRITKLLWYIITWPSAALTLIFGLSMLQNYPTWPLWLWVKVGLVLVLYGYHFYCHYLFVKLQQGVYPMTSGGLRLYNEVATVLLVSIVFLVVLKSTLDMTYGLVGLVIFAVLLMLAVKLIKKFRQS